MGWVIVFSYYGVALLCLGAAMVAAKKPGRPSVGVLVGASLGLVVLGVCKQFNLPSALTEIGRIVLRSAGLMPSRRVIQAILIVLLGVVLLLAGAYLVRRCAQGLRRHLPLLLCSVYLCLFVVLRAISLHQYEAILGYTVAGARLNWIGELAGIYGVGAAAVLEAVRTRRGDRSGAEAQPLGPKMGDSPPI